MSLNAFTAETVTEIPSSNFLGIVCAKIIDEINNEIAREKKPLKSDLPANTNRGTINWLGSSYTGQDMKVVAHLYESSKDQLSPRAERLQDDLFYFESILSGASSLLGSITQIAIDTNTFAERSDASARLT